VDCAHSVVSGVFVHCALWGQREGVYTRELITKVDRNYAKHLALMCTWRHGPRRDGRIFEQASSISTLMGTAVRGYAVGSARQRLLEALLLAVALSNLPVLAHRRVAARFESRPAAREARVPQLRWHTDRAMLTLIEVMDVRLVGERERS
jgi:hypothetical protein